MTRILLTFLLLYSSLCLSATIAIIDTGFDLDHDYLKPKILKKETDEEPINFHGWDFHDNSHLKTPVIEDKNSLQEILRFRDLRAKGHKEGLSISEFDWFKKRSSDKDFMEKVRLFKKHSHGTFVAGIALREGENINIFPIRGLNIPNPVVAVEDSTSEGRAPLKAKTPVEKFKEEIKNSLNRVSRKFSKICRYLANKNIEVVNASYGITYKNLMTKFGENHLELTGKPIDEASLKVYVEEYFAELYKRGAKTISRYPKMLFVFSAGNSALDNDSYHHYPSRIKLANAITVAAMNGDYLASFSNFGKANVDIGAPGVAILSLVPKVYSQDGSDLYSPASGTSMAAPHISNLAAQILNANPGLLPGQIRQIILQTGDVKEHLRDKLASAAIVNNSKAVRAAIFSRDMLLAEAINLAKSDIVPIEDRISIGMPPAVTPVEMKKKIMESIPRMVPVEEIDDEPTELEVPGPPQATRPESSSGEDPVKGTQDTQGPPASTPPETLERSSDQSRSSQTSELSPQPSEDSPASSSQPAPSPQSGQSPESAPSSPQ
ncbi:MAG TPA: S8 family serine peptidase [Bacteriovoracaceae bacterium]|nr:S8 family serine peptidase [Bacteriovoracaceae bacterium]